MGRCSKLETKRFVLRKRQIVFNTKVESLTSDADITEETQNDILLLGSVFDSYTRDFTHYKYINGYRMAVRLVFEACANADIYLASRDQMCHPYLYLCRHTIELKVKALLKKYCSEMEFSHDLESNWNTLAEYIVRISSGRNVKIVLENLSTYIKSWDLFDKSATRNRYPERKNESNFEKRIAINVLECNILFENFFKQIDIIEREIEIMKTGF